MLLGSPSQWLRVNEQLTPQSDDATHSTHRASYRIRTGAPQPPFHLVTIAPAVQRILSTLSHTSFTLSTHPQCTCFAARLVPLPLTLPPMCLFCSAHHPPSQPTPPHPHANTSPILAPQLQCTCCAARLTHPLKHLIFPPTSSPMRLLDCCTAGGGAAGRRSQKGCRPPEDSTAFMRCSRALEGAPSEGLQGRNL